MPANSFPKTLRLLTPADYRRVFDSVDLKQGSPLFTFLARQNDKSRNRLGIIAAKRNIRSAANRNRMKRLVRESFRLIPETTYHKQSGNKASFDVIVLVKAGSDDQSNATILDTLDGQWKKLNRKAIDLNHGRYAATIKSKGNTQRLSKPK